MPYETGPQFAPTEKFASFTWEGGCINHKIKLFSVQFLLMGLSLAHSQIPVIEAMERLP